VSASAGRPDSNAPGAWWTSVVLAVLLPAAAGAQTLDDIVAKHVAVRGGAAKLAAVESVRMTAKARAEGGREALLVREVRRPGRLRLEFTSQGMTGVYAYDGERGWRVSPFDGEMAPQPMPPESVRMAIEQSDIGGPLVDWKAKGHHLKLAGRVSLEGREAWKLTLTTKDGDVQHVYLDSRTWLQVRTESTRVVRGHAVEMETTFGDYRETNGVLFPRSVEIGAKGRPGRLTIAIQTVEVNPVLDDSRFKMPDVR
jgi:outer membrane lipoprotein-sorting protein